jgi:FkbM family methyltransferase
MKHSQNNEQDVILAYFGASVGAFLDIGANDGRTFSNTHALALAGWHGVCVEPSPVAFASLSETYRTNLDIELVQAAITAENRKFSFHQASDTLVSSLDSAQPERWSHHNFTWDVVEVQGMTFPALLESCDLKQFDMISIDAEGYDYEILRQMDLDALRCKLICVEYGTHEVQIGAHCRSFGMQLVHRNGENVIYAR